MSGGEGLSMSDGEGHSVLKLKKKKKKIVKTQINKGNKRGDKIPWLWYLVPGGQDTVDAVSCPRGQNNPEGDKIPHGILSPGTRYHGGQDKLLHREFTVLTLGCVLPKRQHKLHPIRDISI